MKDIQYQIDNVRKTRTARQVRKLYLCLDEIIRINELPAKVTYEITGNPTQENLEIYKALGLIVLGENTSVDIINES